MKKILVAAVLTAAFSFGIATPSSAQVTVFDPTNFVKNTLTEAHTLQVTINQATEIANQLRSLSYELQNLQNIPVGLWGQVRSDLNELADVAKVGQSISYADQNLIAEFVQMYPGFVAPEDYNSAYKQWGQNTLDGIEGALASAGLQETQFSTEDDLLASLGALSDGSVGHLQAAQVGNMIAVQQVQQLQKLRQLQMAQLQGEFAYLATQQQQELSKYATLKAWFDSQSSYRSSE